ncbi:hypothetical protein QBC43DRAFT_293589 [Cladorrhinum sp. PSN259]|nr:hypothetical protein QBC43DRAFT_293589 [Cladorrhinum sp. PSN259]
MNLDSYTKINPYFEEKEEFGATKSEMAAIYGLAIGVTAVFGSIFVWARFS